MLARVGAGGLDTDRVVHCAVHDRVGVNVGSQALMSVVLGLLGAGHRGGRSEIALVGPKKVDMITLRPNRRLDLVAIGYS